MNKITLKTLDEKGNDSKTRDIVEPVITTTFHAPIEFCGNSNYVKLGLGRFPW